MMMNITGDGVMFIVKRRHVYLRENWLQDLKKHPVKEASTIFIGVEI